MITKDILINFTGVEIDDYEIEQDLLYVYSVISPTKNIDKIKNTIHNFKCIYSELDITCYIYKMSDVTACVNPYELFVPQPFTDNDGNVIQKPTMWIDEAEDITKEEFRECERLLRDGK